MSRSMQCIVLLRRAPQAKFCAKLQAMRYLSVVEQSNNNNQYQQYRKLNLQAVTEPVKSKVPPPKLPMSAYLMLFIPVTTFGLGYWQVRRREWKRKLLEQLDRTLNTPPVPLPQDLTELTKMEYRRVIIQGEFEHEKEILLYPRSLIDEDPAKAQSVFGGSGHGSNMGQTNPVGAQVITPFRLTDRNYKDSILVNRGWVPAKKMDASTRQAGQIKGKTELVCIVRKSEKKATFTAENDMDKGKFYNRDVPAMSEYSGTSPVYVEAIKEYTVPGGPIAGQTRTKLFNDHLSYIITWWALCGATLAMWWSRYGKILRPR